MKKVKLKLLLKKGQTMKNDKISLKEMFQEYAKNELEFIEKSDPDKLYNRVIPNFKDRTKGSIDFLYKKIVVGGMIDGDTIYLNKLRVSKFGKEEDIDTVIAKITEVVNKGDMKLENQLG